LSNCAGVFEIALVNVGDVERAIPPEPVVDPPNAAATPAPRPDIPVATGSPVPFVSVTDDGMPRAGVVSVGEFDRTTEPEPVEVVAPVPP